jgi:hypothetical protein
MDELNMDGLSKGERRRLKRKARKELAANERTAKSRNKMIKAAGGILAVIVIIVSVSMVYSEGLPKPDPRGSGTIIIEPTSHNFGNVPVSGGVVSTIMDISNNGLGNLIIDQMDISCMCTSATIVKDGTEGPRFGMHTNPGATGWFQSIEPGETAQLKIYYDPTVHRDHRGPTTRTVTVFSNDPSSPQITVKIELNQVA